MNFQVMGPTDIVIIDPPQDQLNPQRLATAKRPSERSLQSIGGSPRDLSPMRSTPEPSLPETKSDTAVVAVQGLATPRFTNIQIGSAIRLLCADFHSVENSVTQLLRSTPGEPSKGPSRASKQLDTMKPAVEELERMSRKPPPKLEGDLLLKQRSDSLSGWFQLEETLRRNLENETAKKTLEMQSAASAAPPPPQQAMIELEPAVLKVNSLMRKVKDELVKSAKEIASYDSSRRHQDVESLTQIAYMLKKLVAAPRIPSTLAQLSSENERNRAAYNELVNSWYQVCLEEVRIRLIKNVLSPLTDVTLEIRSLQDDLNAQIEKIDSLNKMVLEAEAPMVINLETAEAAAKARTLAEALARIEAQPAFLAGELETLEERRSALLGRVKQLSAGLNETIQTPNGDAEQIKAYHLPNVIAAEAGQVHQDPEFDALYSTIDQIFAEQQEDFVRNLQSLEQAAQQFYKEQRIGLSRRWNQLLLSFNDARSKLSVATDYARTAPQLKGLDGQYRTILSEYKENITKAQNIGTCHDFDLSLREKGAAVQAVYLKPGVTQEKGYANERESVRSRCQKILDRPVGAPLEYPVDWVPFEESLDADAKKQFIAQSEQLEALRKLTHEAISQLKTSTEKASGEFTKESIRLQQFIADNAQNSSEDFNALKTTFLGDDFLDVPAKDLEESDEESSVSSEDVFTARAGGPTVTGASDQQPASSRGGFSAFFTSAANNLASAASGWRKSTTTG